MTKTELEKRLFAGERMCDLFTFFAGQECEIYKAESFQDGDEIIYIPDIYLNEIIVEESVSDTEELKNIMHCVYTGDDFLTICDGSYDLALEVFSYCDWQHPWSAYYEIMEDKLRNAEV